MEVEVQSIPREHKTKRQVELRGYKGELARYKAEAVSESLACSTRVASGSRAVPDRNHYWLRVTATNC